MAPCTELRTAVRPHPFGEYTVRPFSAFARPELSERPRCRTAASASCALDACVGFSCATAGLACAGAAGARERQGLEAVGHRHSTGRRGGAGGRRARTLTRQAMPLVSGSGKFAHSLPGASRVGRGRPLACVLAHLATFACDAPSAPSTYTSMRARARVQHGAGRQHTTRHTGVPRSTSRMACKPAPRGAARTGLPRHVRHGPCAAWRRRRQRMNCAEARTPTANAHSPPSSQIGPHRRASAWRCA
jgi:hypothetical protein